MNLHAVHFEMCFSVIFRWKFFLQANSNLNIYGIAYTGHWYKNKRRRRRRRRKRCMVQLQSFRFNWRTGQATFDLQVITALCTGPLRAATPFGRGAVRGKLIHFVSEEPLFLFCFSFLRHFLLWDGSVDFGLKHLTVLFKIRDMRVQTFSQLCAVTLNPSLNTKFVSHKMHSLINPRQQKVQHLSE